MLYLLNTILYKYVQKPLKTKTNIYKYMYKRNKEYFRLILKNIIFYYKNIFNPFFENDFKNFRLPINTVNNFIYKEENFIKNFYC